MSNDKKGVESYEPAFNRKQSSQGKNILVIFIALIVVAFVVVRVFT